MIPRSKITAVYFFGVLAGMFFVCSSTAFAATITVNSLADTATTNGSCTLREAINNANSDGSDTTGGDCTTGSGADTITFSVSGTITANSTFPSIIDADTTITGPGSGSLTIDVAGSSDTHVFIVTGVNGNSITGITISGVKERAIYLSNSDNNTLTDIVITGRSDVGGALIEFGNGSDNNELSDCNLSLGGLGVRLISNSNYNTVDSCVSHDNYHSGITIYDSSYNTLSNNTVENIGANGFGVFVILGADNNTISGNIIRNNSTSGVVIGDVGADLAPTSTNTFTGNTITGNGNIGISFNGESEDTIFEDNTISNNINGGVFSDEILSGLQFIGNTIANNTVSHGIDITNATNIIIGGSNVGDGNTISGNDGKGIILSTITDISLINNTISQNGNDGIYIQNSETIEISGNTVGGNSAEGITVTNSSVGTISGNYIGFDATGISADTNTNKALLLEGTLADIDIGSTIADDRNYIYQESVGGSAFTINPDSSQDINVIGNYININVSGDVMVDGGGLGIAGDLSGVIVGGTVAGSANIISGILSAIGLTITGADARVFGNYIGTNVSGEIETDYGNFIGVLILADGATGNQIGGINVGEGNTIAGNEYGIAVGGSSGAFADNNSILGNSIFGNTEMGIDHVEDFDLEEAVVGHTANDSGDGDAGPNGFLNHPVITGVNPSTDIVTYNLDVPTGYYRVEFFKNPTYGLHSSGYGEGEIYVDAAIVQSTGSALTGQTRTISGGIASSDVITATATKCTSSACTAFLSTSEFSDSETPAVPSTGGSGGGSTPRYGCQDPKASNYNRFVRHMVSLCKYPVVVPATPSPVQTIGQIVVQNGSRGENARKVQQAINQLGIFSPSLGVDGIIGPQSFSAIKTAQTFLGIIADGIWGTETQKKFDAYIASKQTNIQNTETVQKSAQPLPDRPLLKFGSKGEHVLYLQKLLNKNSATIVAELGPGSPGKETIYFGPATLSAVKKFQSLNGLDVDGIVGAQTWAKLEK